MKYAVPLGLLLLVGIVPCLQRVPSRPAAPERRGPVKRETRVERPETESTQEGVKPPPRAPSSVSPSTPSAPKPVAAPAWKKAAGSLEEALLLSGSQKTAVEQILQDRENEIRSCHDALRRAGFVDIRDYDWRAGLMKASWYRKIDALLDARQQEAFIPLVQRGFLNEGLAFTVEPGMTILD